LTGPGHPKPRSAVLSLPSLLLALAFRAAIEAGGGKGAGEDLLRMFNLHNLVEGCTARKWLGHSNKS